MSVNPRPLVLFVDDNIKLLRSMEFLFRDSYEVKTASSVATAKQILLNTRAQAVVVDLDFSGQEYDGLSLIQWMTDRGDKTPIIVLSGDTDTKRVVRTMQHKSLLQFVVKDSHGADSESELRSALKRAVTIQEDKTDSIFITKSPRMTALLKTVDRIAAHESNASILIYGETGTGKEVLTKQIASRLRKKVTVANMAAIPESVAESTLFGHVRGSFTGAHQNQIGLIEQAHGGVFFLDELGECTLEVQAKLLRVIQEREVHPIGAPAPRKVSVRFISATNRDLDAMVLRREFREDLLQRLNTIELRIPPLRERPEDIEFFARQYLEREWGGKPYSITSDAWDVLLSHSWPGNMRQLDSVMTRVALTADDYVLNASVLHSVLAGIGSSSQSPSDPDGWRSRILFALSGSNGNRTKAAQALKISSATLFRHISRLGISEVIQGKPGRPSKTTEEGTVHGT